ncbi:head-to-tail connector [Mycobacterium phage Sheen]|uniref:Head-to-tail connector n=1 Tax=Mycobacterium phage Sheen TaxID=1589274 RepID=A0A0B5A5V3_9CAUD|nr:head-tail connector protein [Mycobacterium phage Sheen]AJD82436.1 head-to-tail connector [Mycobacterium phage Sheen]
MRIRSKINGGLVTVSDEVGEKLIALSTWEKADKPVPQKPRRRRKTKAVPNPEE